MAIYPTGRNAKIDFIKDVGDAIDKLLNVKISPKVGTMTEKGDDVILEIHIPKTALEVLIEQDEIKGQERT
jgi:hypothetical protein